MKLVVHKMKGCPLCKECLQTLFKWNIRYKTVYDNPEQDRPYPYITIELEYEEFRDWISREKIQ